MEIFTIHGCVVFNCHQNTDFIEFRLLFHIFGIIKKDQEAQFHCY